MMNISTCVLHVTALECFCRGLSSGPEGRRELRRKRDERRDTVLALLALLVRRGVGGLFWNIAPLSMLWGLGETWNTAVDCVSAFTPICTFPLRFFFLIEGLGFVTQL